MVSCLESTSMDERHEEVARNEYSSENEYSASHDNARNTSYGDDRHGKGTGSSGGHSHWLPDCSGQIGIINYSNFQTSIDDLAGNSDDLDARTTALARSLYSNENEYSASLVDTSANVQEGQYVMS